MPEYIERLRPDRDLQCYFERPSAIAALSFATPTGFKVSGTWRQQFDWCVVEWNQHNVYEHPSFRNLPDGDFTGYTLTYDETRENTHLMDSDFFHTVDWPFLRIWTRVPGIDSTDVLYKVRLRDHAVPIEGAWVAPAAELELSGTITAGDYIGVSFLEEQYNYQLTASDTLATAVEALKEVINTFSDRLEATRTGNTLRVEYVSLGPGLVYPETGFNGNKMGIYGFVSGARTESWTPEWTYFSGGQSPGKWRITLPFGTMKDISGVTVPVTNIRKMRWTYAAQMQMGAYQRSEFVVSVTNWTVTAPSRVFKMAGKGSRRIEDRSHEAIYSGGAWSPGYGNFSDGSIRFTTDTGGKVTISYTCPSPHTLFLGTRYAFNGAKVRAKVDGVVRLEENLLIRGEDTLCRLPLGAVAAGTHTFTAEHAGAADPLILPYFYFDFLEIAIETTEVPVYPDAPKITPATDWDTDHSIALAPERTAWMINLLGYKARANHYVGALWYYELVRQGHVYASTTVTFTGAPVWAAGNITTITIGNINYPDVVVIEHLHRVGDTLETMVKAFEHRLNSGYNSVHAVADGGVLTIYARAMGREGNDFTITASTAQPAGLSVTVSSARLSGGTDGEWRTDLTAMPRLNRAARDWSLAFYLALKNYNIDVVAAFSMELQHGDPSEAAGIAQRYYNGWPVMLNTPALQTNFSPTSTAFWRQVYLDMADIMSAAGITPYLQFGEVQWWYFPAGTPGGGTTGMTFYDQYTRDQFQARYGRPMGAILSDFDNPALFPDEVVFLPSLIGEFTDAVIAYVKSAYPAAKFEVLYPTDVNNTPLNRLINYPPNHWTPAKLDNLKTESFTFTITRHLDNARMTVDYGGTRGFPRSARSFLVGIGDPTTQWLKEVEFALAENLESIVLFALDQYCLVGYATPLPAATRRTTVQG